MADPAPQSSRSGGGRPTRAGPDPGLPPGWDTATSAMPRYAGQGSGPFYPPEERGAATRAQPGTRPPGPPRAPGQAAPRGPGAPTQVVNRRPPMPPGARGAAQYARAQGAKRAKAVRDVHNRRVLRRLDVASVFKVSFFFYFCVWVVLVVAGVVIWNVAATFGLITSLDKLVRSLFALTSFKLHPLTALEWGGAAVALLCLLGVFVNVLAALLYNLISDLVGGVQVFTVSDMDA